MEKQTFYKGNYSGGDHFFLLRAWGSITLSQCSLVTSIQLVLSCIPHFVSYSNSESSMRRCHTAAILTMHTVHNVCRCAYSGRLEWHRSNRWSFHDRQFLVLICEWFRFSESLFASPWEQEYWRGEEFLWLPSATDDTDQDVSDMCAERQHAPSLLDAYLCPEVDVTR